MEKWSLEKWVQPTQHTAAHSTQHSAVVSHFSNSISPTTTFWELGLGFFGIRVILRGKLGLYAGVRLWRNGLWRSGYNPLSTQQHTAHSTQHTAHSTLRVSVGRAYTQSQHLLSS